MVMSRSVSWIFKTRISSASYVEAEGEAQPCHGPHISHGAIWAYILLPQPFSTMPSTESIASGQLPSCQLTD